MVHLHALGRIELHNGQREAFDSIVSRPKRLAILAYLCIAGRGDFVRRDVLLALFWPDSDPDRARSSLSQSLYVLRRALGAETVPSRGRDDIGVDLARISCDVLDFREALDAGDLDRGLALYGGDLLPGLHVDSPEFDQWLAAERLALRNEALEAALRLGESSSRRNGPDSAAAGFRRALEIVPESEAAVCGLIEALWQAGRRIAAIEEYERFATRLSEQYGVQPGADLEATVNRIRRGEPAPRGVVASRSNEGTVRATPDDESADVSTVASGERALVPSRRVRSRFPVLRVALPFAIGALVFVLLGMWAVRDRASAGLARYDAEVEYGKAWAAWLSGEKVDSAVIYATRAIEADSGHARAWALRAYAGLLRATRGVRPARDVIPAAYEDARRAVALDDTLAAAVQALASAQWISKEWGAAEATYRRALSLRTRGMWEALGRIDLSALFMEVGRCDEAWEVIEPYARLEPLARPYGSIFVVRIPYYCRDWPTAIREADRAIEGGDASFRVLELRFLARLLSGDLRGADADLADMRERLGPGPALDRLAALLLVQRGDTARARAIANRLVLAAESGDPFQGMFNSPDEPLIELLVAVGDRESAFARMDSLTAFKGHVRRLASDPLLDPLRSDPRMDALLAQMALICRGSAERRVCQPIE